MTVGPQEEEGFTPGIMFDQVGVKGADGSIPGLYNLVQSAVEDMLKATYVEGNPAIDNPLTSMFAGLRAGIALPLSIIEGVVQRVTGNLNQLFLSVDHALDQAGVWFDDILDMLGNPFGLGDGDGFDRDTAVNNLVNTRLKPTGLLATLFGGRLEPGQEPQTLLDTWDQFWQNIFGDGRADVGLPGFGSAVDLLHRIAANATDAATTGLNLFNFPASQKMSTNPTIESVISFGHLRKFTVSGSVVSTAGDPESITVTQTVSAGLFIRFDKSREVDVFTWKGKGNTSVTTVKAHVWRMDTTVGSPTYGRVDYVCTVSVNPAGLPTASFDNVYAVLPVPVHVDPGTVLGAEVCITGAGSHSVAGVDIPWMTDDLTARPKRFGFSRNSGTETAPPASIADASVPYSTRMAALGLGQALTTLPVPKYLYTDSFDSGTTSWKALVGSPRFTAGLFKTGSSSHNFLLYNYATNGDTVRAEFEFRATWFVTGFDDGDKIRLAICCSPTASQYVALEIESNLTVLTALVNHDLRIVTGTSPTATPTTRAAGTLDLAFHGNLAIEYRAVTNTVSVFVGGDPTPVLSWPDTGHILAHGGGFQQAAIYANLGATDQNVCDNFVYKDV